MLRQRDGVNTLLCEGGPRVYASVLAAGVLDDEFLTLSPIMIGSPPLGGGPVRPSLVEGVAFDHESPPRLRPLTLRRVGDLLFMRSRFVARQA
jgi:riboflavin biosynthesis pyrimidine reductase